MRIEFADSLFVTREKTSKYIEQIKGGKIRQFSFDMGASSIITFPAYPIKLYKGWIEIRGIALSGWGGCKVAISTDEGRNWQAAKFQKPVLSKANTYFRHLWNWNSNTTEIISCAIDESGCIQSTLQQLINARGTDIGGCHLTLFHLG